MGRWLAAPLDHHDLGDWGAVGRVALGPCIYLAHGRGGDGSDFYFDGVSPSLFSPLWLGYRASHELGSVAENLGNDDLAPP